MPLALVAVTVPPMFAAAPVLVSVEATLKVKPLSVLLAPLISNVPVLAKVRAVMFTVPLLVSVVPLAMSSAPVPLKPRAVVKPAVVNKVPPPKVIELAALPRLPSEASDKPPALSEIPPLTVFAPDKVSVPAPALVNPLAPANSEEIVVETSASVVTVLAPAFAPLSVIVLLSKV